MEQENRQVERCFIPFKCVKCNKEVDVYFTKDELDKWTSGEYNIQDCFPNLTPGEREMFLSGICDDCWNALSIDEMNELIMNECDPEELEKMTKTEENDKA